MKIVINCVFYSIIIVFPIMVYFFYFAYTKTLNKKEKHLYLDLALLLSIYLGSSFCELLNNDLYLVFSTITIYISAIYKRFTVSLILYSIFLFSIFPSNIFLIILLTISYLLEIILYNYSYIKRFTFAVSYNITSFIFFYFNYHFLLNSSGKKILLVFVIANLIIILFVRKSRESLNLFTTLKDLKKDNILTVSLFKITHEIKNPLAVVKGYLDMMNIKNKKLNEKYLHIIKSEVERTLNILSDFNNLNKITIKKDKQSFNNFIFDLKDLLIPYFENNKMKFDFKIINSDISINIDDERIKQVIINIIKNSIEAGKAYDKIIFSSYIEFSKLFIIIEDTCGGMSKEVLENIYTPFFTTKNYGTGLGACLSKEIVESHKGTLHYDSKLNKGTTVTVVLPID